MNRTLALQRILVLCVLGPSAACYTQRPLVTPAPPPATRIIAQVTDSGTVAMGNAIGAGAIEIEGVVASTNGNTWDLNLLRVDHRDGRSIPWNRELVSFPRFALTNPTEKRLDKTRSWIAAGIITASAFIAARLFNLIGADDTTGDDPVPQEILIPGGGRRE
jgi:hypothetical protein